MVIQRHDKRFLLAGVISWGKWSSFILSNDLTVLVGKPFNIFLTNFVFRYWLCRTKSTRRIHPHIWIPWLDKPNTAILDVFHYKMKKIIKIIFIKSALNLNLTSIFKVFDCYMWTIQSYIKHKKPRDVCKSDCIHFGAILINRL